MPSSFFLFVYFFMLVYRNTQTHKPTFLFDSKKQNILSHFTVKCALLYDSHSDKSLPLLDPYTD